MHWSLNRVDDIIFDVAAFMTFKYDHLDNTVTGALFRGQEEFVHFRRTSSCGVVCIDDEWGLRLA